MVWSRRAAAPSDRSTSYRAVARSSRASEDRLSARSPTRPVSSDRAVATDDSSGAAVITHQGLPEGRRYARPLMLQRLDLRGIRGDLAGVLPRPQVAGDEPVAAVRAILDEVRTGGDAALRACTERFDGVRLDELRVPPAALA